MRAARWDYRLVQEEITPYTPEQIDVVELRPWLPTAAIVQGDLCADELAAVIARYRRELDAKEAGAAGRVTLYILATDHISLQQHNHPAYAAASPGAL